MTRKEKRNLKLANELREWLLDNDLWVDVVIYFNGKAYAPWDKGMKHFYYNDREHLIEYEDDPSRCVEYYSRDGITMTFEGDLYEIINYEVAPKLLEEFDRIFEKYGLYYELGFSWSLATCEI